MVVNKYKEVRYDLYCSECKHKDLKGYEDPCNECLDEFVNLHSKKPVKFEKEDK